MSEHRNTPSPELPRNPAVAKTDILLYGVSRRRSFVKSKDGSLLVVTWLAGLLARRYLHLSLMQSAALDQNSNYIRTLAMTDAHVNCQ